MTMKHYDMCLSQSRQKNTIAKNQQRGTSRTSTLFCFFGISQFLVSVVSEFPRIASKDSSSGSARSYRCGPCSKAFLRPRRRNSKSSSGRFDERGHAKGESLQHTTCRTACCVAERGFTAPRPHYNENMRKLAARSADVPGISLRICSSSAQVGTRPPCRFSSSLSC